MNSIVGKAGGVNSVALGVRFGAWAGGAPGGVTSLPEPAMQVAVSPGRGQGRKDRLTPDSVPSDSRAMAARLRQREPAALEELYELLAGRAFGLAYRVLGDGSAAEDVVQDAFLWVWNNPGRIDPARGRVESLLMTIVHRRSIDALRVRNRREALRGPAHVDLVDERASDLFAAVADSLTNEHVRRHVDALSEEQRQAIELAYFAGMTHREISDQTGVPMGTVKSRIRLGMEKLRLSFGIGEGS